MFIVMALTQVLGVGAVALIAQAVGRKDQADANVVFNQSVLLAFVCAAVTLIGGYALTSAYVGAIAADPQTQHEGRHIYIGSCRASRSASRRSRWALRCAAPAS